MILTPVDTHLYRRFCDHFSTMPVYDTRTWTKVSNLVWSPIADSKFFYETKITPVYLDLRSKLRGSTLYRIPNARSYAWLVARNRVWFAVISTVQLT